MCRAVRLLLLLLFAVGCQPEAPIIGGKPREKPVQTIVSLSPSTTEIVMSQGLSQKLKGRTAACDYPTTVSRVPVVASVKPDYEKLALIKPDLVVYDGSLYNAQDVEKIKSLGAQSFVFDANTVDGFVKQLYELGALAGSESNLSGYADKIYAARTLSLGDPIKPVPKVAVILPGLGSEHLLAGTKSFVADVVRAAGGDPIGPDVDRFVPMGAESLVTMNPDAIVLAISTDANAGLKEYNSIANDPRLQTIKAVRNKALLPMNQDVVLRRGTRVDRLIENLHKLLEQTFAGRGQ